MFTQCGSHGTRAIDHLPLRIDPGCVHDPQHCVHYVDSMTARSIVNGCKFCCYVDERCIWLMSNVVELDIYVCR